MSAARARANDVASLLNRPVVAMLVVLVVYFGLSLLTDPRGFLGTDTGGKVATLEMMRSAGTWSRPDVGYWAAPLDPTGRVHGLIYTVYLGDQWVNVTSLPMVLVAQPLWRLGGYRAVLLLPMLGAVGCAFVARGLARRLGGGDGWAAFWIVAMASPITVYALDFWEHTIGAALMGAGVVVLFDHAERDPRWWRGLAAGMLFGAAFSMRTEAAVYGVVAVGVVVVTGWWRRQSVVAGLVLGVTWVTGFVLLVVANSGLEQAVLGATFRSGRAASTVGAGGSTMSLRAREAVVTSITPFPTFDPFFLGLGALLVAGLVVWARRSRAVGRSSKVDRAAALAAGVVAFVFLLRLTYGLGFWPGLIATTPIAAVALALGWSRPADRVVLGCAVLPLPLVFLFQFPGGSLPQWAGRYILCTGLLLTIVGVVHLDDLARWARRGFVAAALVATVAGVAWLSVRSHDVATSGDIIEARPEAVLIAREGFPAREFGANYGRKRWLALSSTADLPVAIDVVARSGAESFAIVSLDPNVTYGEVDGYVQVGRETSPFIENQTFTVTSFQRL